MSDGIFENLAEKFIQGKDWALSELVRFLANRLQLAKYGEMTDCSLDTLTKELRFSLKLKGEKEIIEAKVLYSLEHKKERTYLIAQRIWVSREWVGLLLEELIQLHDRRMELPPRIALAAKILGV
jgi:hypothetical protein